MIKAVNANKISILNRIIKESHKYCEVTINECIKQVIKDGELSYCFVPLNNYSFPIVKNYLNKQGYNVEMKNNNIIKINW